MKKIVRLTEQDLVRLVNKVIAEEKLTFTKYVDKVYDELDRQFDLTSKEIDEIIEHYKDDIDDAFNRKDGYVGVKELVNSFTKNGKLKWKR